jgi:hypothetical protein
MGLSRRSEGATARTFVHFFLLGWIWFSAALDLCFTARADRQPMLKKANFP